MAPSVGSENTRSRSNTSNSVLRVNARTVDAGEGRSDQVSLCVLLHPCFLTVSKEVDNSATLTIVYRYVREPEAAICITIGNVLISKCIQLLGLTSVKGR